MAKYLARTLGQVAEFFGVEVQTVKEWRKHPDMPGKAGAWPLDEIARWKLYRASRANGAGDGDGEPKGTELVAQRRAVLLDIEIAQKKGELIEVDIVERLVARHVAVHNTLADELKDKVLALLPRSIKGEPRRRILNGVEKAVADLRFEMATAGETAWKKLARKTVRKPKR